MKVKITTEQRASSEAWDELGRKVKEATKTATGLTLHQMEREAKLNAMAAFHGKGRLAGSIEVRGPADGGEGIYTGEVGPTVRYGRIQELGGPIFPHGHPFLAFFWDEAPVGMRRLPDGRVLARRVVIKKHPYLKPAVDTVRPQIGDIYRAEIEKATTR